MKEQEILEQICDIELIDQDKLSASKKITINPRKLARFLRDIKSKLDIQ